MKPPHPLLAIPGFCLGALVLPWLVFVVVNLISPFFVFGVVLFLGWCLVRKAKPAAN